jgi:uncharacterized protein YqhQ
VRPLLLKLVATCSSHEASLPLLIQFLKGPIVLEEALVNNVINLLFASYLIEEKKEEEEKKRKDFLPDLLRIIQLKYSDILGMTIQQNLEVIFRLFL